MFKIRIGPTLDDIMRACMKTVRTPNDPGIIKFQTCNKNNALQGYIDLVITGVDKIPDKTGIVLVSCFKKGKPNFANGRLNDNYDVPSAFVYNIKDNIGNEVEPIVLPIV